MIRFFKIFCLLCFFVSSYSFAQDARTILERSYNECRKLKGGSYKIAISKKSFNDKIPVTIEGECKFLKTSNDSVVPWKLSIKLNNGDGTLCTANDFVQLKAADSSGVIYSRTKNQSDFGRAAQSEGLFPPFFTAQSAFYIDRLDESKMIARKDRDETVGGKLCFKVELIDLLRFSSTNPQKVEKIFLIDKESYLPVEFSEISTMRIGSDSLVKNTSYKLSELNISIAPHDSLFTYKSIPDYFQLKTIRGSVYHHHLKVGMKAPSFRGKIVGADSLFSQSEYGGKSVMLYFFSRTSYPSLKGLSTVQRYQEINKDMEVLIIGIDVGEKNLAEILKSRNIKVKALANARAIADSYFITATPAFIMVDNKGMIRKIETGFGEQTEENLKN